MKTRSGQTILELLIAFMVIAVGLFAAATLVFSNLNLVQRDADEVVAVNLMREGIELAKQVRDSNWLSGNAFDLGFSDAPLNPLDYTATPVWEGAWTPVMTAPSFSFAANDMTHANAAIVKTENNLYANVGGGVTGNATIFQRLLTFHPICNTAPVSIIDSGTACPAGVASIGIRVESHVRWTRKGTHDLTMYDDLYDWR